MEATESARFIGKLVEEIGRLIPDYVSDPADGSISNGNVAVCIIDEAGDVYGRLFGENRIRARQSFKVAWTKASQVWITGIKTGEYEKKVFNDEISEGTYGISKPDMVGWEGGQPLVMKDGACLYAGFSGFRGQSDLAIVAEAFENIGSI